MKYVGLVIALGIVLSLVAIVMGSCVSYKSKEVQTRNRFIAQQKVCETFHDQMWKVISQKAQVSEKAKDAFKEMYIPLIEGRYKDGGGLMKFITENNPQFDFSLYSSVQNAIEAKRAEFTREQNKLLDIKREHDNLRMGPISSLFLSGVPILEANIVTSTRTSEAFGTGVDDDVKVY